MVQFQDSILKHLHHQKFSSMFFDMISKIHCAQILSCFDSRVNAWFTIWPIFLAFRLSPLIFFITFQMWFGLPHPSIASIFGCVCTHPIDIMGIHFLCCIHGNKCTRSHDVVHNTFVAIVWNVNFHMGWK